MAVFAKATLTLLDIKREICFFFNSHVMHYKRVLVLYVYK